MYKLLLCWRYLLTRYLALACIISVMLGVATLIVVNSVMSGFSTKLKQRLHGLLSDVIIESFDLQGMAYPDELMQRIWDSPIGQKIEAMTPAIEILGLIQMKYDGQDLPPRAIKIIGVDPKGRARLGGFAEFLLDPRNKEEPSFELRPEALRWHEANYFTAAPLPPEPEEPYPDGLPRPRPPQQVVALPSGAFVGYSIANYRKRDAEGLMRDLPVLRPGDEIILHTISSGQKLQPVSRNAVVSDVFKSEMSEYDSQYVYVPLDWLQQLRMMPNHATSIQIKLTDYQEADKVVKVLSRMFSHDYGYHVETWEDKQGPLLAAIGIEKRLLNVLLFLIVGVAGFGILAIFAMIVAEKKRDIGILKALGASNGGILKIFIGYALLLGLVGCGLGTLLGLEITLHVNDIEKVLAQLTGHEIFNRSIYYFDEIPTDIQAWSVILVNVGAVAIAVIFSVLPALRAALLHPVQALRYE